MSDEKLVSRIYEEPLRLNNKGTDNSKNAQLFPQVAVQLPPAVYESLVTNCMIFDKSERLSPIQKQ